ncbi:MAG: UDP-N-acetylglucosamine:LPS N-acetylglucosamine transferase [Gammaproteobacteria bacterium]|jgi:UDP-N-acetylglucosamine:LPS N-acetylglucosamine transferase
MNGAEYPVQFLFICGKNEGLAKRLARLETRYPKHVSGYCENMAEVFALADFAVGKPRPGFVA